MDAGVFHRVAIPCAGRLLPVFFCVCPSTWGVCQPPPGRPRWSHRPSPLQLDVLFPVKRRFSPLQIIGAVKCAALAWPMSEVDHQQTSWLSLQAELCVVASCQHRSAHFESHGSPVSKGDTNLLDVEMYRPKSQFCSLSRVN